MAEKKRAKTPSALSRARAVHARKSGKLVGSAVARLTRTFASAESADKFASWRLLPETQLFIDALRECAANPMSVIQDPEHVGVEYGITSGFQVAAMLIDDPSLVFDSLFGGATPGTDDALESVYTQSPDGTGADA